MTEAEENSVIALAKHIIDQRVAKLNREIEIANQRITELKKELEADR